MNRLCGLPLFASFAASLTIVVSSAYVIVVVSAVLQYLATFYISMTPAEIAEKNGTPIVRHIVGKQLVPVRDERSLKCFTPKCILQKISLLLRNGPASCMYVYL